MRRMRFLLTPFLLTSSVLAVGCSHKPPADFAPDPGLVQRIKEIRIVTATSWACPGQVINASYEAVLDDDSRVPFATKYDKDRPPRLHVVFLERRSNEAYSQQDGDWVTDRDPLFSALSGFRLAATLKARPELTVTEVVEPEYSCLPHVARFEGRPGEVGQPGDDGPDVTVQLAVLRSPFHDRLLVAAVEVGEAPPYYLLADAERIPPSDWLIVESRGGTGGRGRAGPKGADGAPGTPGCPGGQGGPGGNGGNGAAGGAGGRGGRATIITAAEEPFLAGIVEARNPGGEGGKAGPGGPGGKGGKSGEGRPAAGGPPCANGPDGPGGQPGSAGPAGPHGRSGPRASVITVPRRDVFGTLVPEPLEALIRYTERGGR